MRVIDLLYNAPWAVVPETLETMIDVYERHARGEKSYFNQHVDAIEKALSGPSQKQAAANTLQGYEVVDGVAVIDVVGVIGKRFDLFAQICGGASTQRIQSALAAALDDPTVHSIVLNVDSPGGQVDGTQALANDVYAARDKKRIAALIDGSGTSGAYWIASAASKVMLAGDTTIVGSIGVVMAHTDMSKAQEMRGVKTTEITAGKYKRVASNYAPLSDEGRASLQEIVDHMYSVFVDGVAKNRGTSADVVLKDMADGRVFLGQKAIDAGLADGFSTLGALIQSLNEDYRRQPFGTGAVAPNSKPTGEIPVKINDDKSITLTAEEKTQLELEAFNRGKAEGTAEGATQERERIKAVESNALPGHEQLIAELKFDGKTTGPEAAVKVLQSERDKKGKVLGDLKIDSPNPVTSTEPTSEAPKEPPPQEIAAKAQQYIAEQKKQGRDVSVTEAVLHTRKQLGLK
jgi:signal peptide peptidase SppA